VNEIVLPSAGASRSLLLQGAAGAIECLLAAPAQARAPQGLAVVCHPHPLYGGAMSNKVAYTLAACALKAGLYALRFNFRGVGKSGGTHAGGRGEVDDTVFLADLFSRQHPSLRLALAGFSFGAHVSLMAAAEVQPVLLVSIAPPFGSKYFPDEREPPAAPGCPWLVVHSRDDEVFPYEETRMALAALAPAPQLVTVDGAGHFFHGQLALISDQVTPFIERHWPAP
jgi:uncharacterized protein